jgi:hypothetical protein
MDAGAYRVCRAASNEYEAFISGTLPRDQCTEGYLPLGGELTLVVPSPTAEVAAKLE